MYYASSSTDCTDFELPNDHLPLFLPPFGTTISNELLFIPFLVCLVAI